MATVKEDVNIGSWLEDNENVYLINYYHFCMLLIKMQLMFPHIKKILCNLHTTKCLFLICFIQCLEYHLDVSCYSQSGNKPPN